MVGEEDKLRKVTIVGGGSAGWITAGLIAAKHGEGRGRDVEINVIEAPDIPIIGLARVHGPACARRYVTLA